MSRTRKIALAVLLVIAGVVYGFFATVNRWWVADRLNDVRAAFILVFADLEKPWYLDMPRSAVAVKTHQPDKVQPGLILVSGINANNRNWIRIVDRDGKIYQEWQPDWFQIWPETPDNVPQGREPNKQPGAVLHGTEIAPNGDVIFNYELLSTIRMDACGSVVWKLANLGHHSVDQPDDGTIWVSSERVYSNDDAPYDNYTTPLNSWAIQQLDQDGNELAFKEILEILQENDLLGLMYMGTLDNIFTAVGGDTLHANDVEVFPSDMESEVFAPGDLLISMRNINTIMVVDPVTWKIKFRSTGAVLRQHDPDFVAGDKIIVMDNRNLNPFTPEDRLYSRIVEIDARTGETRTLFKGEGPTAFYTPAMGKQQMLDNGNLLISSTQEGRAFEVDPEGNMVWEYNNIVDDEFNGVLMEAHVLPPEMDADFFASARQKCEG